MSADANGLKGAAAPAPRPPINLARESRFQLGELTIAPALREVVARDTTRQTLEPRVMQVFVALARVGGAIVTRDDLIRTCWQGTVVGEDAVHRAISQLRRVSEGIGRGAFRIETIAKVGYRLVADPASAPANAPAVPQPTVSRRLIWVAAAVMLCLVAAFATWRIAAEGPAYSVTLQPFDGSAALTGFDNELSNTLTRRSVPTAGGQMGLKLTGAIEQHGDNTRVHSRLVMPDSEEVVWSGGTTLSSTDPEATRAASAFVGAVTHCTLAFANDAGHVLARSALSRLAQACQLMIGGEPAQGIRVARQLTRESADFAGGWFAVTQHALALYLRGPSEVVALREEALAAAEKLIALRPRAQEGHVYKALAMPPEQAVEREQLLREAAAMEPIYADVGQAYLGDFLVQAGRLEEAFQLYRQYGQRHSDIALSHVRVFFAAAATGRWPIAEEALDRARQLGTASLPLLLWRQAVWKGDWAEAERQIPFEHPAQVEAETATYRALASGDRASKEFVARQVRPLPAECCVPLRIEMLTQLGDQREGLALLDQFEAGLSPGRRPGNVGLFLWDPALQSLWHESGIEPFLQRHGWIAYWRASKTQPDICGQQRAPSFCQSLGTVTTN